jgi:aerobic-type carbon monoxide dehydrogenase small subunit (CoxS/CutS family)
MQELNLKVNGTEYTVKVKADMNLLEVLRDKLQITSPKVGCNTGDCGACSVIMDGQLIKSCVTNAMIADGKEVTTLEGISTPCKLHPIQEAFHEVNAAQCGFCTPGMIMATKALLDSNPNPTEEEIREGISGNLCRCTGYTSIVKAVQATAVKMNGGK